MWIYILIFAVVLWLTTIETNGKRISKTQYLLLMLCLALFVGLGDMLGGYDRYIYCDVFDGVADVPTVRGKLDQVLNDDTFYGEFGIMWLNMLISLVTKNRYIYILIVTLIIYWNIYYNSTKYTNDYALFAVIFLAFWFFFTYTYLRQVLAVSFAWYGIKFVQERRLFGFLCICCLAYFFHHSAVVFVPLYFIANRQYSISTIISISVILFILGVSGFSTALYNLYGSMADEVNEERAVGYGDESLGRVIYIVEAVIMIWLICKNHSKLYTSPQRTLMTNMAIMFCWILLLFFNSSNAGRQTWFYMIGLIITLSTIYQSYQVGHIMRKGMMIGFFLLFFRILSAWGISLYPYKTFLTDGVREGDPIWAKYEYDHNYDDDKFYR